MGTLGSLVTVSPLTIVISVTNPSFAPSPSQLQTNLPIVSINTNGVAIVDKVTDVPGTITITSSNGQTSYLPNSKNTDNTGTFHLHGNSTLYMPKLAYHVKLNSSVDLLPAIGASSTVCPYGTAAKPTCDKSKSYVLLANYDDKTLLRDWSASALANSIPVGGSYLSPVAGSPTPNTSTTPAWAPHSLFVELYLNGAYEGNYQLIEEVKVDSHRVNITELGDTSGGNLTGGYLMEIDHHEDEDYLFFTPENIPIGMIDPDYTPEVPEQETYISNYVDQAEDSLWSPSFTDPTIGWRAYFDEASAVNFYLVNDIMGNADGGSFNSSDYFFKQVDSPLLYMGPIWDFDYSSGNTGDQTIKDAITPWMQVRAPWYTRWFLDPGFTTDTATQFNALRENGIFDSWIASIQAQSQSLGESESNNFQRWPMLGLPVWPNAQVSGSYAGEVSYLTNWLQLRIDYLDFVLNAGTTPKAATATSVGVSSESPDSSTPVTITATVSGGSDPSGSVYFLSPTGVLLGATALSGNQAAFTSVLPTGNESVQAVYGGDTQNQLSVGSATIAVTQAQSVTFCNLGVSATAISQGTGISATAALGTSPSSTPPTGTITFTVNGTSVGSMRSTRRLQLFRFQV